MSDEIKGTLVKWIRDNNIKLESGVFVRNGVHLTHGVIFDGYVLVNKNLFDSLRDPWNPTRGMVAVSADRDHISFEIIFNLTKVDFLPDGELIVAPAVWESGYLYLKYTNLCNILSKYSTASDDTLIIGTPVKDDFGNNYSKIEAVRELGRLEAELLKLALVIQS